MVIYGYGPEVDSLMREIDRRGVPLVLIEEDETTALRLHARGHRVVHASLVEGDLDLRPLGKARALVANGPDENDALLAMTARELGFRGPIVALIDNPHRRAPMLLAGVTTAFTPKHVLAAAVAVRASTGIGQRITPAWSRWGSPSRSPRSASTTRARSRTRPSMMRGSTPLPGRTSSLGGWMTRCTHRQRQMSSCSLE